MNLNKETSLVKLSKRLGYIKMDAEIAALYGQTLEKRLLKEHHDILQRIYSILRGEVKCE